MKMRRLILILLSGIIFFGLQLFSNQQAVYARDSSRPLDRIIVKYRTVLPVSERFKLHRELGAISLERIEKQNLDVLKVDKSKLEDKLHQLSGDPRILYAEPDYIATTMENTTDPSLALQWGLVKVKAAGDGTTAWSYSKSNPNIKIAILDTGIDINQEDLVGKVVSSNNCTDSLDANDYFGHGTHVAGIAAAVTNNRIGVAGMGYNATLIDAKGLGDDGSGYYSWIANCLIWAADNGAKVINMSFGGSFPSQTLANAINYAWSKNVVLVAAAGNSGNSLPLYPAYYKNVISVAATDVNDQKPFWSSYGYWVSVAAPGLNIYSTLPNHTNVIGQLNYGYLSGTSMATPFVSGLAALVWTTKYGTSNSSVRSQIQNTADRIPGTGNLWKYGRINALKAVSGLVQKVMSPWRNLVWGLDKREKSILNWI